MAENTNPLAFDPLGIGFLGPATIPNGGLSFVVTPGTGYTGTPTGTVPAPPTVNNIAVGAQSSMVLNESGGAVGLVSSVPGAGYTTAPTVVFTGSTGSGASVAASLVTDIYIVTKFSDPDASPVETELVNSDGSYRGTRAISGTRKATMSIEAQNATQIRPQVFTTFLYTSPGGEVNRWGILKVARDYDQKQPVKWNLELVWQAVS